MNELSERSRQIAMKAVFSADGHHVKTFDADSLSELIEQALLAERAKVWEEAIGISYHAAGAKVRIIEALRAAAEKEVGK